MLLLTIVTLVMSLHGTRTVANTELEDRHAYHEYTTNGIEAAVVTCPRPSRQKFLAELLEDFQTSPFTKELLVLNSS